MVVGSSQIPMDAFIILGKGSYKVLSKILHALQFIIYSASCLESTLSQFVAYHVFLVLRHSFLVGVIYHFLIIICKNIFCCHITS